MNLKRLSAAFCAVALACLITLGCPLNPDPAAPESTPTPVPAATTGNITGKVNLNGASSSEGISVCIEKIDGLVASSVAAKANGDTASRAILSTTTTDASGSYSFADLEPASYTVYAVRSASAEQAASTVVTVLAAVTVTAGDLNLTATGSVTGTITMDGFTTNLAGIMVCLAGTSWSASTDASGSFTISGVPVGSAYSVVIMASGKSTLLPDSIAVAADTATDLGTVAISSFGGVKHAVNIVVTNIPADYAMAKFTMDASVFIDGSQGNFNDWNSTSSSKVAISNGTANLTIYLSDVEAREFLDTSRVAFLRLYKAGSDELSAGLSFSTIDNQSETTFLTDTYISASAGTLTPYNVRITGFGDVGYAWATGETINGSRVLYFNLSQSTIDTMKANPGVSDNFNLVANRYLNSLGYPIIENAMWTNLASRLGSASDMLNLDFSEVAHEYVSASLVLTQTPTYLSSATRTATTYTPTGGTGTNTQSLDYNSNGVGGIIIGTGIDISVAKSMQELGGTISVTYNNGAAYSWTLPAGLPLEAILKQYLSFTDATVISPPVFTSAYTLSSISSAGTSTVSASTLDALATGCPFTPNKLEVTWSVSSSSNGNLNMNAYISSGISPANYNLFATNGSVDWITHATGYFITGGYGTSFAGNTGGTPGDATYGLGRLQCTKTVLLDYPLTASSMGITIAADSSATVKGIISISFRLKVE